MPAAYATPAQLAAWLPDDIIVSEPERLLQRASRIVDRGIRRPIAVDDDGIPTDADYAQALADATCAQVESWQETDEANDLDGNAGKHISVTGYAGPRGQEVAPRAMRELILAGLTQIPDVEGSVL